MLRTGTGARVAKRVREPESPNESQAPYLRFLGREARLVAHRCPTVRNGAAKCGR